LGHIGVREALSGMNIYLKTFRKLISRIDRQPPDAAVLLDFAEFNLRLAKKLKKRGVPVIYYISPQVWAWRSGRVRSVRACVDKMMVILPFEEEYYRERGVTAEFVGHPLLEEFNPDYDRKAFFEHLGLDPERKTVAIIPGSRRREIAYILPVMLEASRLLLAKIPAQFVVSVSPAVDTGFVNRVAESVFMTDSERKFFHITSKKSRDIMANADYAFVKSGTSSLEAALVGVPFLITYKISALSWFVGSLLIRSSMKGLVNLLAREIIVPELFQREAKPESLAALALEFLESPERSAAMRARLAQVRASLSMHRASKKVAAAVCGYL
ncbi:MAG TPA: lipid-A-disaccharide synthase, partial [Acidobacteriota bacterium]|nr:lipid-A-disaccharide synthase [Acidobacteriota bacterium]